MARQVPVDTQQLEFTWRAESGLQADLETAARRAESDLQADLEAAARIPVHLIITDNRSTIMSLRHDRVHGRAVVRLHRMFLAAGADVVHALARWIHAPRAKAATEPLNRFIRANRGQIAAPRPVHVTLEPHGTHFALDRIFDEVNQAEFGGNVDAGITWGRMPTTRRRRSIRFGSYYPRENVIRIHPLLDQAFVPGYFVRYIVFHEMLHAALGIEEPSEGRRRIHTRAFLSRERAYVEYARAVAWQANPSNLNRLLSRRS